MSEEVEVRFVKTRGPTKKEKLLHKKWVKYLSDSRLPREEIYKRAKVLTLRGERP